MWTAPWYKVYSSTCFKIVGAPQKTHEQGLEECENIGGNIWEFDFTTQTIIEEQGKDFKNFRDENNCQNRNIRLNVINYPENNDYEMNTNNGNLSPSGCR